MKVLTVAVALVVAVLAVQLAAGGGEFVPARPADACRERAFPPVESQLEPLAERLVLIGLDHAACELGLSRERLVLALAVPLERRALGPEAPAALKRGLRGAVDRLQRERQLPRVSAVLPEVLDLSGLPGIVQTAVKAVPDSVVDDVLPTAPLLRRAVDGLDVPSLLGSLEDPGALQRQLQGAILDAARAEIVAGLPEPLRGLLG